MTSVNDALRKAQQVGLLAGDGTPGTFTKWANTSQVADSAVLTESDDGEIIFAGNIIPSIDNEFTLGDADHHWKELWSEDIYVNRVFDAGFGFVELQDIPFQPATDAGATLGAPDKRFEIAYAGVYAFSDTVGIVWGNGAPTLSADVGSVYLDLDGGPYSTFYVKEAGSGTGTGWTAFASVTPGTVNKLPKYTGIASPTPIIGDSGITDDGIDIVALSDHFKIQHYPATTEVPDSDQIELQMQTGDSHYAIWRYEHRLSGLVTEGSITPNLAAGEMQLFLNGSSPSVVLGEGRSYFLTGVAIKTPPDYPYGALVVADTTGEPAFRVWPDGNLSIIRYFEYIWPDAMPYPVTEGAMKVLGYKNTSGPAILQWYDPVGGTGGISPGGPVGYLAKFTPDSVSVGPAGVFDDGSAVYVQRGFVIDAFHNEYLSPPVGAVPADYDLSQAVWGTGAGNGAIWRYEHRTSGFPEGASSPNIDSGEMQLFLNGGDACVLFGQGRSYFSMGLIVKPPEFYPYPAFLVLNPSDIPAFEVDPDGNISYILGQPYLWPDSIPDPTGVVKVLGYNSVDGGYAHLAWVTMTSGSTSTGSGTVGLGTVNTLAMFTGSEIVQDSHVKEYPDPTLGRSIRAECDKLIAKHYLFDLAQVGFETYTGGGAPNFAIWRYEHRPGGLLGDTTSPNIIGGEMQLFLNSSANPYIWLGQNRSYFNMGVTIVPPVPYPDSALSVAAPGNVLKFAVQPDGDMSVIKSVGYQWPSAPIPTTAGMKVLAYLPASPGVLDWHDLPAPTSTVSGTVHRIARFTAADAVGNSGMTDDDTVITVERAFVIDSFHAQYILDPTYNLSEATWHVGGVGVDARNAVWRYECALIRMVGEAGLSPNGATGEMQLFLNSGEPCVWLGQQRSFFRMGLSVIPPGGYTDAAFSVNDPSNATLFQIKADGDLSVIKSQTYQWPDNHGPGVLTADASGHLTWVAMAGGLTGAPGHFPIFNSSGSLADISHLAEDLTGPYLAFNEVPSSLHTFYVRPAGPTANGVVVFPKVPNTGSPFAYQDSVGGSRFQVDSNGNLALIYNLQYTWPSGSLPDPASGMKVLGYTSISGGAAVLGWQNLPTAPANIVTGIGTATYLPKFTGPSTLGNSAVFDDGTEVVAVTPIFKVKKATGTATPDLAEMSWETAGSSSTYAIWRYDHSYDLSDLLNSDGEMQLFINDSTPRLKFGRNSSYFSMKLRVRPGGGAIFSGELAGGSEAFRVDGDGNLGLINRVPYFWPAPGATTVGGVLTYGAGGSLSWALPASGSVSGSGTDKRVALWTGTPATLTSSNIIDNTGVVGTMTVSAGTIGAQCNQMLYQQLAAVGRMDFYLRTNIAGPTQYSGIWRYEQASPFDVSANSGYGEMQLMLSQTGVPAVQVVQFGEVHSWLYSGLRIRPTSANTGVVGSAFEVDNVGTTPVLTIGQDGDLSMIRQMSYHWPAGPGLPGPGTVLTHTSFGNLAWDNTVPKGAGTLNTLPKYTVTGAPATVGDSNVTDDGTNIQVRCNAFLIRNGQAFPAFDLSEAQWVTSGTGNPKAIWRYQHNSANYADANNTGGGEMQLFLQGFTSTPTCFVGDTHSWFQSGLRVRPLPGYPATIIGGQPNGAFECWAPGAGLASFRVDTDGNLSMIRGQTGGAYAWPTANAAGVLTNNGSGGLSWLPAAGGISGSGSLSAGVRWTGASSIGASVVTYDDGGSLQLRKDLLVYDSLSINIGALGNAFTAMYATTGTFANLQGFGSSIIVDDQLQLSNNGWSFSRDTDSGIVWTGTPSGTITDHQFMAYCNGLQVLAFTANSDAIFIRVGGALQAIHVASGTTVPGGGRALYI